MLRPERRPPKNRVERSPTPSAASGSQPRPHRPHREHSRRTTARHRTGVGSRVPQIDPVKKARLPRPGDTKPLIPPDRSALSCPKGQSVTREVDRDAVGDRLRGRHPRPRTDSRLNPLRQRWGTAILRDPPAEVPPLPTVTGHWRSWLARLHDTQEVTGSNPVWPTRLPPRASARGGVVFKSARSRGQCGQGDSTVSPDVTFLRFFRVAPLVSGAEMDTLLASHLPPEGLGSLLRSLPGLFSCPRRP